jgi:glycine betaine/choline ABC-type transport system substrate-binding protein
MRGGWAVRRSGSPSLLAGALILGACGHGDRIVVGSKNFTESDLLGEIVAQQIERRTAVAVERRFHLGGTFVCHQAITSGQIDLYVEYTGTAYTAVLKHAPVLDPDSVYRAVAAEYERRFGLTWGKPLGFDNTFAILVRRADAERYGLLRISDLAAVAPHWHAGFGYEFLERADGFPGLARIYGLRFAAPPTAMDLGLTYRALAQRRVDVIALQDDRHYFPPYQAAVVTRAGTLARHPEVAAVLAQLEGKLAGAEMQRLNALADVEHRDIGSIAREWLRANVP